MTQNFRHADIINIAHREGKVTVDNLAERFGVTLQTIRRDLTELAAVRKLERVHGGAVPPSGTTNIEYDERRRLNAEAKTAIARTCAARIDDGSSVFLNIGTTTEAVAQQLLDHKNLMVVTNNMNVASIMGHNTSCQTIVTGGALRRSDGGLIGHVAVETIRQFKFDIAVIGCSALDDAGDLLDFDVEEVSVSRAIIAQSRTCYLVADHSKLSRSAPVRIASMKSLTGVITDAALPAALAKKCEGWRTQTILSG